MNSSAETFQGFLDSLGNHLSRLPQTHQLAFAAACCERAFPNYAKFSRLEKWGRPAILRTVLDRIWGQIAGESLARAEAHNLELECKRLAPNSDDFPSEDASASQDAALMFALLARVSYETKASDAVRIAAFRRDTIDMRVQMRERLSSSDPDLESKIARHPLMLAELARQKDDLQRLARAMTVEDLCVFRDHARTIGE
jgi:uncharacterized protein